MTEHIDSLRVIRQRLAEVTQPIGLELREMDVRVAESGVNDLVVALFTIEAEQIGKSEQQVQTDAQIAEMERQMQEQTREEKAVEARKNLDALFQRYRREE